jgi:hypothetical protein
MPSPHIGTPSVSVSGIVVVSTAGSVCGSVEVVLVSLVVGGGAVVVSSAVVVVGEVEVVETGPVVEVPVLVVAGSVAVPLSPHPNRTTSVSAVARDVRLSHCIQIHPRRRL